jgi:hypothetical protein
MFKHGFDVLASNAPEWYKAADTALEKDNYNEAARLARDAIKKSQDARDKKGEALGTISYTKVLLAEGDVWNAIRSGDSAQELAKEAKDRELEAAATHLLAKCRLKDKKISEASKLADEAMQIYTALRSEKGELSVSITNSAIFLAQNKLLEAQTAADTNRDTATALGGKSALTAALYMLCEIAVKDEAIPNAEDALRSIVDVCNDVEDYMGAGSAHLIAAELWRVDGELQHALDHAANATQLFDQALDADKKAQAVISMAKSFLEAAQYQEAKESGDAALALFKMTRNRDGQASSLRVLAETTLRSGGGVRNVIYQLEEVSFLYRQIKHKKNEAEALNELTKLQMLQMETDTAECLRRARRAAQLFDEDYAGDSLGNAEANLTVAKVYLQINDDVDEGIPFAKTSREVYRKLNDTSGEAEATLVLSRLLFAAGNKSEGAGMAEVALNLSEDSGSRKLQESALDLVQSQGKQKQAPLQSYNDITVFIDKTRIAFFDEFEARRAKYKAMDRKMDAGKPEAEPAFRAQEMQKDKASYTIIWTRVQNLNLTSMPMPTATPENVTSS